MTETLRNYQNEAGTASGYAFSHGLWARLELYFNSSPAQPSDSGTTAEDFISEKVVIAIGTM